MYTDHRQTVPAVHAVVAGLFYFAPYLVVVLWPQILGKDSPALAASDVLSSFSHLLHKKIVPHQLRLQTLSLGITEYINQSHCGLFYSKFRHHRICKSITLWSSNIKFEHHKLYKSIKLWSSNIWVGITEIIQIIHTLVF